MIIKLSDFQSREFADHDIVSPVLEAMKSGLMLRSTAYSVLKNWMLTGDVYEHTLDEAHRFSQRLTGTGGALSFLRQRARFRAQAVSLEAYGRRSIVEERFVHLIDSRMSAYWERHSRADIQERSLCIERRIGAEHAAGLLRFRKLGKRPLGTTPFGRCMRTVSGYYMHLAKMHLKLTQEDRWGAVRATPEELTPIVGVCRYIDDTLGAKAIGQFTQSFETDPKFADQFVDALVNRVLILDAIDKHQAFRKVSRRGYFKTV